MSEQHQHTAERVIVHPFTGTARDCIEENRAAHGGTCEVEMCECGASREVNRNQNWEEVGRWTSAEVLARTLPRLERIHVGATALLEAMSAADWMECVRICTDLAATFDGLQGEREAALCKAGPATSPLIHSPRGLFHE